jgi:ADP-ribose pyrophosphatase YjhB (NUDIX family)
MQRKRLSGALPEIRMNAPLLDWSTAAGLAQQYSMNVSQSQPLRRSISALAVFQREQAGQLHVLAKWNTAWQTWALVGGHKRPDETFRQCVIREIEEELGLAVDGDVAVDDNGSVGLEFTAWSQRSQSNTRYEIEVFAARLLHERAQAAVAAEPHNRWLTHEEIRAGRCHDGTSISETLTRALNAVLGGQS